MDLPERRVFFRRHLRGLGGALAGCVALVALLEIRWEMGRRELLESLSAHAKIAARGTLWALDLGDGGEAARALSVLEEVPAVAQAVIFSQDGSVIARWERARGHERSLLSAPGSSGARFLSDGTAAAFVPLSSGGRALGTLGVRAGTEILKRQVAQDAAFAVVAAAAAALALASALRSQSERSLRARAGALAAKAVAAAAASDGSAARDRVQAPNELQALDEALDGVIDALRRRDAELARVPADLEQEVALRTGELAASQGRLEEQLAQRREAGEALEHAVRDWSVSFDAIREGVLVLDRNGAIRRCNRAILALLGRRMEEVEGAELGALLPAWCSCPLSELRFLSGRQTASWKHAGRSYEARLEPIVGDGGEQIGWVQILADLTEQRRLQTQFMQSQKMEAIGRLAGGVAHDFNNILAAILSYTRLLLEDMPAGDPLRDDVQEIRKAGERAASLTRQLLAFSRKQVLTPEVLCVGDLVADMAKMVGRLVGEQIQLSVEVEGKGCALIDKSQLEQVVVNMVVNARDAMPDGGRLKVRVSDFELDARDARAAGDAAPGPYVRLLVEDTGAGMSEETLKKIFEPFFTTKPLGRGTGLGLAMVYGAVRQAGGRVTVKSTPGTGTSFRILLPRVQAEVQKPAPAPRPVRGKGEPILLVEDDAALRRALGRLFEDAGYRVHTAADGEEAYGLFIQQGEGIQLVVTDVVMPGRGGLALGERLLARRSDVRILYITGYSEDILRSRQPKATVLFKPFEEATLLARVRELLDGPGPGARAAAS